MKKQRPIQKRLSTLQKCGTCSATLRENGTCPKCTPISTTSGSQRQAGTNFLPDLSHLKINFDLSKTVSTVQKGWTSAQSHHFGMDAIKKTPKKVRLLVGVALAVVIILTLVILLLAALSRTAPSPTQVQITARAVPTPSPTPVSTSTSTSTTSSASTFSTPWWGYALLLFAEIVFAVLALTVPEDLVGLALIAVSILTTWVLYSSWGTWDWGAGSITLKLVSVILFFATAWIKKHTTSKLPTWIVPTIGSGVAVIVALLAVAAIFGHWPIAFWVVLLGFGLTTSLVTPLVGAAVEGFEVRSGFSVVQAFFSSALLIVAIGVALTFLPGGAGSLMGVGASTTAQSGQANATSVSTQATPTATTSSTTSAADQGYSSPAITNSQYNSTGEVKGFLQGGVIANITSTYSGCSGDKLSYDVGVWLGEAELVETNVATKVTHDDVQKIINDAELLKSLGLNQAKVQQGYTEYSQGYKSDSMKFDYNKCL